MSGPSVKSLVFEASPSQELRAEFDRLRDATTGEGLQKYSDPVLRRLATLIIARGYGSQVLQLCHLLVAARHLSHAQDSRDFLVVLMELSERRVSSYGEYVRDILKSDVPEVGFDDDRIQLRFVDSSFSVHTRQIPLLLALMEFSINAIGLEPLCRVVESIDDGDSESSPSELISSSANRLSRLLYAYLDKHLQTTQAFRQSRHLIDFMQDQDPDFSSDSIDDATVLAFWLSESEKRNAFGTDFKQFVTVYQAFVALLTTLDVGRSVFAKDRARSIGNDWASGEIDPGVATIDEAQSISAMDERTNQRSARDLVLAIEEIDADANPLDVLSEPPLNRVKFVNKSESKLAAGLCTSRHGAVALPMSYLRSECFSKMQRSISRAKPDLLKKQFGSRPSRTFDEHLDDLRKLKAQLQRVGLAALHVLNVAREESGNGSHSSITPLDAKRAEAAFRGLNRMGFDASGWTDPQTKNAFEVAGAPLSEIIARVDYFMSEIEGVTDWDERWEHDLNVFRSEFFRLYGSGVLEAGETGMAQEDQKSLDGGPE